MSSGTLQVTTPTDREIVMSRVFDAPRQLVWKAMVTPELLKRWLGVFDRWKLDVCQIDLRVGGKYRYEWSGPDGARMGMGGVYHEITPPSRLVATELFDDPWYPGEAVSTMELREQSGTTNFTLTVRYASKEIRDGVLQGPMKEGVEAGYDTLAALLKTLST
jgi:uncharacterized protein YndB with AHSA1/START domain